MRQRRDAGPLPARPAAPRGRALPSRAQRLRTSPRESGAPARGTRFSARARRRRAHRSARSAIWSTGLIFSSGPCGRRTLPWAPGARGAPWRGPRASLWGPRRPASWQDSAPSPQDFWVLGGILLGACAHSQEPLFKCSVKLMPDMVRFSSFENLWSCARECPPRPGTPAPPRSGAYWGSLRGCPGRRGDEGWRKSVKTLVVRFALQGARFSPCSLRFASPRLHLLKKFPVAFLRLVEIPRWPRSKGAVAVARSRFGH